jgi:hypothetical protein
MANAHALSCFPRAGTEDAPQRMIAAVLPAAVGLDLAMLSFAAGL